MITKLPENINLEQIKNEWLKIGLSTEPTDIENAEKGVDITYTNRGLVPPKTKIWLDSPYSAMILLKILFKDKYKDYLNNFCWGQHETAWLSFYWVFKDLIKETKILEGLWLIAKSCGWWLPFSNIAILTKRPIKLHLNEEGQLHYNGGMAIEYADGFGLFRLNGVNVPEWLAVNKPESIDPLEFTKIDNVEVRREFVRKIGMERIIYKLQPEILDKQGNYELFNIDLRDGRKRLYLKMLNPSINTWHVEGIEGNVLTIQEALNFRNHLSPDQIDDVNGADWYQQGDVIIRPKNIKKFKSQPIILT